MRRKIKLFGLLVSCQTVASDSCFASVADKKGNGANSSLGERNALLLQLQEARSAQAKNRRELEMLRQTLDAATKAPDSFFTEEYEMDEIFDGVVPSTDDASEKG